MGVVFGKNGSQDSGTPTPIKPVHIEPSPGPVPKQRQRRLSSLVIHKEDFEIPPNVVSEEQEGGENELELVEDSSEEEDEKDEPMVTELSMTSTQGIMLGVPAVRQVLARLNKSDQEEQQLIAKIETSCRRFDRTGKGYLSPDEYFNVIKLQNGVEISKDEVKKILDPLPKDKTGKIKIDDFLQKDIHSNEAFKVMDRNKDGFITKGELKLAKKNVGMRDIDKCIKNHDLDKDGKLNLQEFNYKP